MDTYDIEANDEFRLMNAEKKLKRNKRLEDFVQFTLPKLQQKYEVKALLGYCYLVNGNIKLYPKAQTIYYNKMWIKKGFYGWIRKNLLSKSSLILS